jgi:hypothetical protein
MAHHQDAGIKYMVIAIRQMIKTMAINKITIQVGIPRLRSETASWGSDTASAC